MTQSDHLSLRIVQDMEGLTALQGPWNRLLDSCCTATVFNSWEWAHCWWKHYGDKHALRICVIENADEVVSIAPFYLQERGVPFFAPLRTLMIVGSGGDTAPDYLDVLCLNGFSIEAHNMLISHIFEDWQEWNRIDLTDMPVESTFGKCLEERTQMDSRLQRSSGESIHLVDLEHDWEAQMASFPTKKRTKIRSRRRNMKSKADARFGVWKDEESIDEAMDTLIALHHKRWDERSAECSFSSEQYNRFHRDLMSSFYSRGWLNLYYLENDKGIFAMDYCFSFRGTVMQFQRGFDPEYYDLSPGDVLMMHSFEHAIESNAQTFDFLRGDYPHKQQFATRSRETVCFGYHRLSLSTITYNSIKSLKRTITPWVKSLLRPKACKA